MAWFYLNSVSSAASLVFDLPSGGLHVKCGVFTLTLRENQKRSESRLYLRKNTIFYEQPVYTFLYICLAPHYCAEPCNRCEGSELQGLHNILWFFFKNFKIYSGLWPLGFSSQHFKEKNTILYEFSIEGKFRN